MDIGIMEGFFGLMATIIGLVFGFGWIVLLILIAKALASRDKRAEGPSRALEILEARYARGEVSREEFLERRAALLGEQAPS